MKFSEKWLREWVDPPVSTDRLAEQLTMAGLEVEGVVNCQPEFSGVIVAKVLQIEKHPSADTLHICRVSDGKKNLNVVCGATNVRVNGNYPLARAGATLPGELKIQKTEIKGVQSEGMLCSGAELGLMDAAEIIMELSADATPGTPLDIYLGLDDHILELSLTPNRGDCLSILGIAREVGVINGMRINRKSPRPVKPTIKQSRQVKLAAAEACPRYAGRVVTGVNLHAATPVWMTERLRRSDLRSINIIVDITNYVMLELGQPMHAFDLDLIQGGITVRFARDKEKLVLLDGGVAELTPETLVIADEARAIAMAGIMGGMDTCVSEATSNIFLESAYFTPEGIMGRPRLYGLHTDSSHRFERGVDYTLQVKALERATGLVRELCGGKAGPVIDVQDPVKLPHQMSVRLRSAKVTALLGTDINKGRSNKILKSLGMKTKVTSGGWQVKVPPHRFDLSFEEDLIEEIARIYGYDRIPTHPITATLQILNKQNGHKKAVLSQILVNRGYHEAMTYSFVDPALQDMLHDHATTIPLANPISSELGVMRQSLWPGLLTALLFNLKRQQQRVRLFEYGRVFTRHGENIRQDLKIAAVLIGNNYEIQWDTINNLSNFYDMKGDIAAILTADDSNWSPRYRETRHPALHPGRSAEIIYKNQLIGLCGELHPWVMRKLEIINPVYLFELDCTQMDRTAKRKYKKISKYPSVRRDISILVDRDIPVEKIIETINKASPLLLDNLELFDVYHGEGIDILKKSLAFGLTFQASSSTLIDAEVEGEVNNIVTALNTEFDVKLRE